MSIQRTFFCCKLNEWMIYRRCSENIEAYRWSMENGYTIPKRTFSSRYFFLLVEDMIVKKDTFDSFSLDLVSSPIFIHSFMLILHLKTKRIHRFRNQVNRKNIYPFHFSYFCCCFRVRVFGSVSKSMRYAGEEEFPWIWNVDNAGVRTLVTVDWC